MRLGNVYLVIQVMHFPISLLFFVSCTSTRTNSSARPTASRSYLLINSYDVLMSKEKERLSMVLLVAALGILAQHLLYQLGPGTMIFDEAPKVILCLGINGMVFLNPDNWDKKHGK